MPIEDSTDLVVFALQKLDDPDSGALYSLPRDVYTDKKYKLTDNEGAEPRMLLSNGTIVANMPNDGTGTGGFCYLLNIPALQPPSVNDGSRPKLTAKQLITAIKKHAAQTKAGDGAGEAILKDVHGLLEKHGHVK